MDPRKIKDDHLCFQKLLKLPSSLRDLGNFSNFWKHSWYYSLILLAPMILPTLTLVSHCTAYAVRN